MAEKQSDVDSAELAGLIDASLVLIKRYCAEGSARWLLVDVIAQQVIHCRDKKGQRRWPVSTAIVGLDNRIDSGGTPPGVHRIGRKIGADAEPGTVFASREPTGEMWRSDRADAEPRDLILTRILTLDGLEPGVNQGPGVDSRDRYIYIHGTNWEKEIGQPVSGGCIRMTNPDVRELFERVDEGDPVVII